MTRWILLCLLLATFTAPAQKPRTLHIGSNEIRIMDGYAYINGDRDSVSVYTDTFSNGRIKTLVFFPWTDSDQLSVISRYGLVPSLYCLPCELEVWHQYGKPGADGAYAASDRQTVVEFAYTWYESGSGQTSYDVMPDSAGSYLITEYTAPLILDGRTYADSLDRIMHLHLRPHALDPHTGLNYDIDLEGVCSSFDHFNKIRRDLYYRKSKLYKEDIYRGGTKVQTVIYDKD